MGKAKKVVKLIVFDMDETIGAFTALSRDLIAIQPHLQNYALIKHLIDTNPDYIRPHMLEILKQVYTAKMFHAFTVVLYTSNPNSDWVLMMLHYINNKIHATQPLFDHVLDASQRTTPDKCVQDLLDRTNIRPKQTQDLRIFFVDDQYHAGMITKEVVYFHITPYREPNPNDVHASELLFAELRDFING